MNEFYTAYAEYLERMLAQTDEIAHVIEDTVPDDCNLPVFEEWATVVD